MLYHLSISSAVFQSCEHFKLACSNSDGGNCSLILLVLKKFRHREIFTKSNGILDCFYNRRGVHLKNLIHKNQFRLSRFVKTKSN